MKQKSVTIIGSGVAGLAAAIRLAVKGHGVHVYEKNSYPGGKLSLIEKSKVWLLCSDNQIIWVIGKRQDERFKITKQTTKILQINFTNE